VKGGETSGADARVEDPSIAWAVGRYALAALPAGLMAARAKWTSPTLEYASEWPPTAITIVAPWIESALRWTSAALAVALVLLLAVPDPQRRKWMPGRHISQFGFLAVIPIWFGTSWVLGTSWHVRVARAGPDDRTYALISQQGMGDFSEALCVESASSIGLLRTRYEVLLVVDSGGSLRSASMIRPGSEADAVLSFGADGMIAAVERAGCNWVYDARNRRAIVDGALPRLSPFLLLDGSTSGREDDVATLTARVAHPHLLDDTVRARFLLAHPDEPDSSKISRDAEFYVEIPTETSLLDALDSPNAWIRSAARRIVEAGGADMYPEATRKLAPK
jgi:hypothetical protein